MKTKTKVKTMFDDVPVEERQKMLFDNCQQPEVQPIRKKFTVEEIADFKERQVGIAITLQVEENKKNEFMEEYRKVTKEPKLIQKELLHHIRTGFIEQETELYTFDNQAEGVMEYYDEKGELVYERPLYPREKQTSILTVEKEPKSGTSD